MTDNTKDITPYLKSGVRVKVRFRNLNRFWTGEVFEDYVGSGLVKVWPDDRIFPPPSEVEIDRITLIEKP